MKRLHKTNFHKMLFAMPALGAAFLGGHLQSVFAAPSPYLAVPRLIQNQALVVSGAAQWCPRNKPAYPLRQGRPQAFSPGDTLRCGPHSRLQIRLTGNSFSLDNPGETWQVWPIPSQTNRSAGAGLYLPTLGRTRGGTITLSIPVTPSAFVIAWPPDPRAAPLSLRLLAPDGKVIWQQASVDVGAGGIFSSEARRALTVYQAGGGGGQIILLLLRDGKPFQQIRFTLSHAEALSGHSGQSLRKE